MKLGVRPRQVHFIGIGGIGMSALAEIMRIAGHTITGSDAHCSPITKKLADSGVQIQYDHTPRLIKDADIVVYTSAVGTDNPERLFAAKHNIVSVRRGRMQGDLMRACTSVAVAGTHGKTTTTSLVAHLLASAGKRPTVIVGGILKEHDSNALVGDGDLIVAEADEFDRSFLDMYPTVAVVTNIEADHLDCYRDLDDIKETFVKFLDHVPFYGFTVLCIDDPGVESIRKQISSTVLTCGLCNGADYRAANLSSSGGMTFADIYRHEKFLGRLTLKLIGTHNVKNAIAALAVAMEMDVDFASIAESLKNFAGVKRRFEIVGISRGITIVDDYAHHPSEIAATLSAASRASFKRVVAVFQPHLYSRTRDFLEDFAKSLGTCDLLYVTEIYRARGEVISGVTADQIVELARKAGHASAHFVKDKDQLPALLAKELQDGDGVIIMGAGDINTIAKPLLDEIENG